MKRGLIVLALVLLSAFVQAPYYLSPKADAIAPTTHTMPLTLSWAQNFSSSFHIDTPPSPFTFYPNGTIKLANSKTIFLKFNIIPIPFQAPTSFQANNTYVVYSEKGPGPNCFLNWAFKQGKQSNNQGNMALVQMFGTAAQPCAVGATISIKLNAFGSQLQAFNSTGGSVGSLCDIQIASIEWNSCPQVSTLTSVTLTYSAGTIQLKTTAAAWNWSDPLAIDGTSLCHTGNSNTCLMSLTTSNANDIIIVISAAKSGSGIGGFATASDTAGLTYHNREDVCSWESPSPFTCPGSGRAGSGTPSAVSEDYAVAASTLSADSITCTQTGNGLARISCVTYGISGANTGSPFDSNAAVPCTNVSGNGISGTTTSCTLSTSNTNDMIIGSVAVDGTVTIPGGFSTAKCSSSDGDGAACSAYEIVSSTQTNLNIQFTISSSLWAEIGDAVQAAPTTVTVNLSCKLLESGGVAETYTLSGGSPSPTSGSCTQSSALTAVTVNPSTTLTVTVQTDGASARYRGNSSWTSGKSYGISTPASGASSVLVYNYYQLLVTYQAAPNSPLSWDASYELNVTGTYLGAASTVGGNVKPSDGGGAASISLWFDYDLPVSLPSGFNSKLMGVWSAFAPNSFTDTTGGGTDNVNYILSGGPPSHGGGCPVGYYFDSQKGCLLNPPFFSLDNPQTQLLVIVSFLFLVVAIIIWGEENKVEFHGKLHSRASGRMSG